MLIIKSMKKQTVIKFILPLTAIITLMSCSSIDVKDNLLQKLNERVNYLVIHSGGSIKNSKGSDENSHNSVEEIGHLNQKAHYLIPQSDDGIKANKKTTVKQLLKESSKVKQTGINVWQGNSNVNGQSIVIELENSAECNQPNIYDSDSEQVNNSQQTELCFYADYSPEQIQLIIKLSKDILARNPSISPTQVIGNADASPQDKNDPGPRFPWYQLYQQGIGAWYNHETVTKYWRTFVNKQSPNIGLLQNALHNYGYNIIETGELDQQTQAVLTAFQMHFLPWQVTARADDKTAAVLFSLLDKYFPLKAKKLNLRYQRELTPKVAAVVFAKKGQIDSVFPQIKRSTRELVNDRDVFKSYRKRGQIIIDNNNANSADIYVNGRKLNIAAPLMPNHSYSYSLKKRTRTGKNTLRVENVIPEGASINVTIPYPQLIDKTTHWRNLQRFKKVDTLINQDIENGFPGAVLLVIKNGEILKNSAYGYSRKFADGGELLAEPPLMTTNTLFDIASNTKMFATNFALMKLVSENKLDVNKAIVDYLPLYRGAGRETRLVKDILTHNAGYAPQVKFFTHDNKLGEQFFSQNSPKTKQLILTKVPFTVGRDNKRIYSDTDFMLLGMLVENITGQSLDKYVENEIYHSLHLENTVFNPLRKGFVKNQIAATEIEGNTRGGRVDFDNVRRYVLQGEVHDEKAFYSLNGISGHAGLFSTATDLAVLAQTLLNRGGYGKTQLFSSSVIDQFIKPDDGDGSYGLGWRRADNGTRKWQFGPYASASAYGHTGWTGTVTVIDPEHDLAIILLTNARHSKVVGDDNYHFKGKEFETGKYGSVISLVYEALLER